MISKKDLDDVGSTKFLSCVACKVGCVNAKIHQNVTDYDIARGLMEEYTETDSTGKVLKSRVGGGCLLLDDNIGCLVESDRRPIACLVCPLQIDSEGNVLVNAYCPDVQKIVLGLIEKDPEVCKYIGASVRIMMVDSEFCIRSAEFADRYVSKVVLGKASDLYLIDKEMGE